jgi:hypothetical protein
MVGNRVCKSVILCCLSRLEVAGRNALNHSLCIPTSSNIPLHTGIGI